MLLKYGTVFITYVLKWDNFVKKKFLLFLAVLIVIIANIKLFETQSSLKDFKAIIVMIHSGKFISTMEGIHKLGTN